MFVSFLKLLVCQEVILLMQRYFENFCMCVCACLWFGRGIHASSSFERIWLFQIYRAVTQLGLHQAQLWLNIHLIKSFTNCLTNKTLLNLACMSGKCTSLALSSQWKGSLFWHLHLQKPCGQSQKWVNVSPIWNQGKKRINKEFQKQIIMENYIKTLVSTTQKYPQKRMLCSVYMCRRERERHIDIFILGISSLEFYRDWSHYYSPNPVNIILLFLCITIDLLAVTYTVQVQVKNII